MEIVWILLASCIPLAILGCLGVLALLAWRLGGRKAGGDDEETRLIQELHRGLERMEQRVEALETLLLRDEGKERQ